MGEAPDFDALYRADPDPWRVATSVYERRKLQVVLASLTQESYGSAWDPASGTGELAAQLADRCAAVLATDGSAEAVRLTRTRCDRLPTVTSGLLRQPAAPPTSDAGFDLIVVAEFAYYLPAADRADLWQTLGAAAAPTAEILLVHWRHRPHDGYLSGEDVNREARDLLTANDGAWQRLVSHDESDFVLELLRREQS